MRIGIKFKLIAYTIILMAVTCIAVAGYAIHQENKVYANNLAHDSEMIAQTLAVNLVQPVYNLDITKMNTLIRNVSKHNNISYIYITDPRGVIITDGSTENAQWNKLLPEVNRSIDLMVHTRRPVQQILEKHILVTNPIKTPDNKTIGLVVMKVSLNTIYVRSIRAAENILIVTLILLLIGSVIAFITSHIITKPLFEVIKGMQQLGKRDFDYRLPEKRRDEIGLLAHNLNLMADELKNTTVSKEHLDNIVNLMGDMLFILDENGIILEFNQQAMNILGYPTEELVGMNFSKIAPAFHLQNTLESLRQNQSIMDINLTLIHKSGADIHVLLSKSVLSKSHQQITEIIVVAQDLTRLIELENKTHQTLSEMQGDTKNDGAAAH